MGDGEQHSLCEYQIVFHFITYHRRYGGKTKIPPYNHTIPYIIYYVSEDFFLKTGLNLSGSLLQQIDS